MQGLQAALWLLGLVAAAPVWRAPGTVESYELPDRLRDALTLGVAIALVLGLFHLLYPPECWIALLLCLALALKRHARAVWQMPQLSRPPYFLLASLALIAWPQLVRPLLDGDSLSYHLPNVAAWVQSGSLWTTATHYWWYPPASELFASALYATSGAFALPWCGLCALTLLGFRIYAWAREAIGTAPLLADALAAATVTAFPLAIQGGTLQNDVWLAAFWLEALWALRSSPAAFAAPRALAMTALIKPQGFLLAAIALLASRANAISWLIACAALGMWAIRDAILWYAFATPQSSAIAGDLWNSSILAHAPGAFALLAAVALRVSPFALLALIAALAGPLLRARALGWAAFGAALLFFALPFGYETSVPQLATGASLRFAAPAIAAGALLVGLRARSFAVPAAVLLAASAAYGCWFVLAIFWNDGTTHVALAVALLALVGGVLSRYARLRWLNAVSLAAAVAVATHLAARHPIDYYNDTLTVNGVKPGVYAWLARSPAAAIGGWGLRLGVVNVLAPRTQTLDLDDDNPCVDARLHRVLLVAVAQSDLPPPLNVRRLAIALACGRVIYRDPIAIVTQP